MYPTPSKRSETSPIQLIHSLCNIYSDLNPECSVYLSCAFRSHLYFSDLLHII